jgi:radical SAM protein with 4Fe4S-binding SPASM domain
VAHEKGVHFDCQFGHISECYYANVEDAGRFKWDATALEEVEQSIRVIADDYRKREKNLSDKMAVYFLDRMISNQRQQKRELICYSGSTSCFIDPYGDVFPCTMLPQAWGNAKSGFDTVWSSAAAQQSRAFIRAKRCTCWTPCETYNSLMNNPRIVLANFWRDLQGRI